MAQNPPSSGRWPDLWGQGILSCVRYLQKEKQSGETGTFVRADLAEIRETIRYRRVWSAAGSANGWTGMTRVTSSLVGALPL